jgi:HAD superfamily hydrolase (TIGR01549 family)
MTDPTDPTHADTAAVLFDIDGTLIDSTYHHAFAWHRAFTRFGIDVPMWRVHRTIGMGGDKLVEEVAGSEVEKEHGDALRAAWAEEYAEVEAEVDPLPGASDLVGRLASAGYLVALASSGEKQFSENAVRALGVADSVHTLTTSADVEASKPDPDLVGVTFDKLPAGRAVFVGDTPYDVEAASRLGLACVGLLTGGYSRAELEEAGAALVVDAPTDLVGLDWGPLLRTAQR